MTAEQMREQCAAIFDKRAAANKREAAWVDGKPANDAAHRYHTAVADASLIRALPIPEPKTDAAGPGSLDDPNMYHYGTPSEPVADAAVKALVERLNKTQDFLWVLHERYPEANIDGCISANDATLAANGVK